MASIQMPEKCGTYPDGSDSAGIRFSKSYAIVGNTAFQIPVLKPAASHYESTFSSSSPLSPFYHI